MEVNRLFRMTWTLNNDGVESVVRVWFVLLVFNRIISTSTCCSCRGWNVSEIIMKLQLDFSVIIGGVVSVVVASIIILSNSIIVKFLDCLNIAISLNFGICCINFSVFARVDVWLNKSFEIICLSSETVGCGPSYVSRIVGHFSCVR
jgi:hypothetical protein